MSDIIVSLPTASYPVQVGPGTLHHLPESLAKYCPAASYALITDTTVSAHYRERVSTAVASIAPCHVLEFQGGEANKTRQTWSDLTDRMLDAGVGRDGAVIALGGGVVGDLAGFVAATYHRGIPVAQIPTSLLAMVDSSVGGKTGVDTPAGKNLVGAYHQPRLVVADVTTLETLPDRELIAGVAECLKHGAIADAGYFDWIRANRSGIHAREPDALSHLVKRSVEIKAAVVSADEKEAGCRATLNFGHTVGHGIEGATAFSVLHGEAVSVGMVCEAGAGEAMGITERGCAQTLREGLRDFGLPVRIPDGCSTDEIVRSASVDKKNREGRLRFAPIRRLGEAARTETGNWTFEVTPKTLRGVLESHIS